MTASDDVPDIRRIKWGQKWLPRYFYQHVYMPVLYCVVRVGWGEGEVVWCVVRVWCVKVVWCAVGPLQLGIKTRLQDFGLMYKKHNCEWLRLR